MATPSDHLTPDQRRLRSSIAAHESWAQTPDRSARTAPARDARWQRYLARARELAPAGESEAEIHRRAEHLRSADMRRMALASAKARRARKTEVDQ